MSLECPSKKNRKKVYTVTWDDESGSEQEPEEPESGEDGDSAFMAFWATVSQPFPKPLESARGQNLHHAPTFDGANYLYWKIRMRAFLRAFEPEGWQAIEEDTESADNPGNLRALIIIRGAISNEEQQRVVHCTKAKDAWEILSQFHERRDSPPPPSSNLSALVAKLDEVKENEEQREDDETSEDMDEINGEELQQAYEKLYEESLNLSKTNDKLSLKLKICESENVRLKGELLTAKQNVIKISSDKQDLCETERNELLKVYSTYEEKL
ncbi:hypothetical protein CsSME_00019833 [Camellia sinensis var. sinensis]